MRLHVAGPRWSRRFSVSGYTGTTLTSGGDYPCCCVLFVTATAGDPTPNKTGPVHRGTTQKTNHRAPCCSGTMSRFRRCFWFRPRSDLQQESPVRKCLTSQIFFLGRWTRLIVYRPGYIVIWCKPSLPDWYEWWCNLGSLNRDMEFVGEPSNSPPFYHGWRERVVKTIQPYYYEPNSSTINKIRSSSSLPASKRISKLLLFCLAWQWRPG